MKRLVLTIGSLFGMLSVLLGAFGAHAFKEILSVEKMQSFQTGIRYQMYHAILLVILGLYLSFDTIIQKWVVFSLIIGTFLFSFSIYLLSFADYWNVNLKFLVSVTPLGGLFLLSGWILLIIHFLKNKYYTHE